MTTLLAEMLQQSFMVRALEAGVIVGLLCPLVGLFLVLRRLSLLADTLSHVALAGVAGGLLVGIPPGAAAVAAAVAGALGIEGLRSRGRVFGDAALAVFLSGGLALALVLLRLGGGLNADLFAYLFGSLITISPADVALVAGMGAAVGAAILVMFKELFYLSFDEEAAAVSGIPAGAVNAGFTLLSAVTVALAMRVVGVLLVSALMVIPVVAALRVAGSFRAAAVLAMAFGVTAVLAGLAAAYALALPAGAAIVLAALAVYAVVAAVGAAAGAARLG